MTNTHSFYERNNLKDVLRREIMRQWWSAHAIDCGHTIYNPAKPPHDGVVIDVDKLADAIIRHYHTERPGSDV